jgi:hypothetical protein
MKLTDTQLVVLSAASQRQHSAVETKLKGGAADKVIGKLLSQHLVEEIPAQSGLPVWRRDDDKGAFALRITARGLAAIGAGSRETRATDASDHGTKHEKPVGRRGARRLPARPTRRGESLPRVAEPSPSRRP